jgi:LysM repeat protein
VKNWLPGVGVAAGLLMVATLAWAALSDARPQVDEVFLATGASDPTPTLHANIEASASPMVVAIDPTRPSPDVRVALPIETSATGTPISSATPTPTPLPTYTPVPLNTPTVEPLSPDRKYKVKMGDTLYSISRRYKVSVDALMEANGLTSTLIEAGQVLVVPVSVTP